MSDRTLPSRLLRFAATALFFLLLFLSASAARAQLSADTVLGAIVGLESKIPADARSAATLGTTRSGSGVVIDDKGLILTIGYLILEAEEIAVTTSHGRTLPAALVAYSSETGFGLVRAQGDLAATPMPIGSAEALEDGEAVLVAGFGGVNAVRPAIVAGQREFAGPWEYLIDKAIFTTPPHPAHSGAGLIGGDGRLIGIGYLLVGNALETGEHVLPGNMFVPVDLLKPILADLVATGHSPGPPRPWLGLYSTEAKGRLLVDRVAVGGPAEAAGLRAGDIVLAVAGEPVGSMAELYRKVWARGPAGVAVPLTVLQGMDLREVTVRSGDRSKWFRAPRTL